jgi:type II secretory pathway pseudopilin PulG
MLMRCKQVPRKGLRGASKGVALVEVVVAVVVLAILVGSVPAAVMAVSNAHFRANQMRIAENLTRNQFEYVKSQQYLPGNVTYPVQYLYVDVVPPGFGLDCTAKQIDPTTGNETELKWIGEKRVYETDTGIQLITVTVYSYGQRTEQSKTLLVSTDYKVARWKSQ